MWGHANGCAVGMSCVWPIAALVCAGGMPCPWLVAALVCAGGMSDANGMSNVPRHVHHLLYTNETLIKHLQYTVRPARKDDVLLLPAVDLAAAAMSLQTPFAFITADAQDIEVFEHGYAQRLLWVAADAGDRPVGYALTRTVDDTLYLAELAVDPEHGRRGLGTRLLETVCEQAKSMGYGAVTLSTFGDIARNAPFYQRHRFRILDDAELALACWLFAPPKRTTACR